MVPNPTDGNTEADTSCITQDIFERDLILDELKRTLQFAATNTDQFRSRTTDLTVHQRKFTKIQTKIEKALIKLQSFNKEANIKIRNDFNDLYYAIVTHLNNLKEVDVERRRASRALTPNETLSNDRRNLPKLSLPEFDGEPTGWPAFFDLFQSLVHNNNAYTDVEKFRYLLLSVKNEPHNLIKSIPITESNYAIALDILKSRYDNKRIIASQHLDKLFDIDICSARSAVAMRNLLNVYHENIKALEVMDFPVKEWDFVLLNLLLRKIPVNTRKEYERSLTNPGEIPKVQGLITFLERELSAEQMISVSHTQSTRNNSLKSNIPQPIINEATESVAVSLALTEQPGPSSPSAVHGVNEQSLGSLGKQPSTGLALADPEFHKPQPVDMILGEDIFMDIVRDGIVRGKPGTPTAINSVFGYLLGGRYVVALPFKPDAPPLGESRQIALARFHKLEYRLERNPQLKADYHACLQEYVDLNHMELADDNPPAGRILWRQSPEKPLRDYRLRTVTFGISSSPYLALRTIKQLAHDEGERFPRASPVLLNDVFVDDVVTGADTTAEALALQQELIDGVVNISINCSRVQSGFKIAVPPSVKALLLWYAMTTCRRYSGNSRAFMLSIRALITLFAS
ncbi:uncharacterized protein LOC134805046 [Cydia splendana]|uniref:uncharacterized protein LOC134805046 n=1 Tax=Cydia splendana TaxID=1100963 RepID=UPI00300D5AC6